MDSNIIRYCGWDIGGAHLKFAGLTVDGMLIAAEQQKCPLWLGVEHLCKVMDAIQSKYDLAMAVHAVTMTGELCDNFSDRQTGVECIVNAISRKLERARVALYGLNSGWRELHDLERAAGDIASANWHASSSFVARHLSDAIVMDFGSTTVDIIPIVDSKIATKGDDDFTRLKYRELIYTGVVRTPVSSMVEALPFNGDMIPIAAEYFATSADVYRTLDLLPADVDLYAAADGGDKSKLGSARRLFRMIGRDFNSAENDVQHGGDEFDAVLTMAQYAFDEQLKLIKAGLDFVLSEHQWTESIAMVGLGCGAHIVERLCEDMGADYHDFSSLIGVDSTQGNTDTPANVCAPAVAVAYLLRADGRLDVIE